MKLAVFASILAIPAAYASDIALKHKDDNAIQVQKAATNSTISEPPPDYNAPYIAVNQSSDPAPSYDAPYIAVNRSTDPPPPSYNAPYLAPGPIYDPLPSYKTAMAASRPPPPSYQTVVAAPHRFDGPPPSYRTAMVGSGPPPSYKTTMASGVVKSESSDGGKDMAEVPNAASSVLVAKQSKRGRSSDENDPGNRAAKSVKLA